MKLLATSCLHLRPETLGLKITQIAKELEDYDPADAGLLLVGDIIDPTIAWPTCLKELQATVKVPTIWVAGNHDHAVKDPIARGLVKLFSSESYAYINTGINIPKTPWCNHHDLPTKDQCEAFYGSVLSDCFEPAASKLNVEVIAMHYPFFWGYEQLTIEPYWMEMLKRMPNLKHIVFGHVHNQIKIVPITHVHTEQRDDADMIPTKIHLGSREVKVHLVSDHRKTLIHHIGDI